MPTHAHRIAALKDSVALIWQAIQIGNFYSNPPPMNCATRPFKSHCPVFSGK